MIKEACWHLMSIDSFEPVKQVTTAFPAKSSLCPVRRIVDSNILLSFKCDVCSTTNDHQGPATPSPTHAAMASANIITYVLCSKLYSATKALPFSFSHFSSNTSIFCEHITLASPASAGWRETCVSTVSDRRNCQAKRSQHGGRYAVKPPETRAVGLSHMRGTSREPARP